MERVDIRNAAPAPQHTFPTKNSVTQNFNRGPIEKPCHRGQVRVPLSRALSQESARELSSLKRLHAEFRFFKCPESPDLLSPRSGLHYCYYSTL